MSMMYLVRHGQASFGKSNYDVLSTLGEKQTILLARYCLSVGMRPDAVYSGALERQLRTAEILRSVYAEAGVILPEVNILPEFNEYDSSSIVRVFTPPSNREAISRMYTSTQAFKEVFETAMLKWCATNSPNGDVETWPQLRNRVAEGLRLVVKYNQGSKHVMVFSSGGAISAALAQVLNISGETAMRLNWQIINTSITRLMYNRERITMAGFNAIPHLEQSLDPGTITYK